MTAESRSSHIRTGRPARTASASANSRAQADWRPSSPLMCSGFPTRIRATSRSSTWRASSAKSARLVVRTRLGSPCAVIPRGSLMAMPMRFFPRSRARMRGFGDGMRRKTDFIINAGMVDSRQGSRRFVAILSKPLRAAEQEVRHIAAPLIAMGVAIAILYFGRVVFITSLVAVMLAFILEPFVTLLVRIRFPRSLASFVVCAAALSMLYLMGLGAYTQLSGLAAELPKYSQRIGELVENVSQKVEILEQRSYQLVMPAHKQPPTVLEPARKKQI